MRIALIHFSCEPCVGGVETVIGAHARLFAAHGHEVTLIAGRGQPEIAGVNFSRLSSGADLEKHLRSLVAGMDCVFVHNVLTMPFEPEWTRALWRLAADLPAVRFFGWVHDLAGGNPDYTVGADSLLLRAAPRVEYVAISKLRQDEFLALTGRESRVIPNGVDPAEVLGLTAPVAALAEEFELFGPAMVVFQPARLLRRKNVEFSLRVAAALKAGGTPCVLLVSGAPDSHNPASAAYALELGELRRALQLERQAVFVHERFAVSGADLQSLYRMADALLFPSRQEGFGLPVLEAALHRIPVFCPDIAPLNTLPADPRWSFAPGCPPEQVAMLLRKSFNSSPEIHARKKVVRDYAWPSIYDKFLAPLLN